MTPAPLPLAGMGIVLTRPRTHAQPLADRIGAAGGHAILFPALEIITIADTGALNQLIDRLHEYNLAIFISPSAVETGMTLITSRRPVPAHLRIAAIGPASAAKLASFGLEKVITPESDFDSEALLGLPELRAVAGARIVIFRGQGGRERLAEVLTARGALVDYAQCYQRVRPAADPAGLLPLWARRSIHAVSVMSVETLRNFLELIGPDGYIRLAQTALFVPHPRIAASARERGLREIVVTGPGDDALLAALAERSDQYQAAAP
jgi:uroporphyrinogen-III synthase